MKRKSKTPKFYISVALKDMGNNLEPISINDVYKNVILGLNKLSETISCGQLAPIPPDLKGSLYDPEIIELRDNDEFASIYEHDFKDTAEEQVAKLMYLVLQYDINNRSKCHVQKYDRDSLYDYSLGTVKHNINGCVSFLSNTILTRDKGTDNVEVMLKFIYPHIVQFAEQLRLDLNVFLRWYIRYKAI